MKNKNYSSARVTLACALSLSLADSALAQTFTWDGGATDDQFGSGDNWASNTTPGVGSGVILRFDGITRPAPVNNYTTGDDFGALWLNSTAGSDFLLTGNGFGLHTKIENEAGSGRLLTLNNAGIYARNNIEINPVGGNIVVGATVVLDNNRSLNVYDGGNGKTLTIDGVLSNGNGSGGNGSLILNQTATVIVNADNTYGTTTINSGATLKVGSGGTAGTLGSGAVANDGSLVWNRSNDATMANSISGSGSLTKSGGGTLTFNNQKTYSGNTVIGGGILDITGGGGENGTLRGTVTINNTGQLRLSVGDATGYGLGAQRITAINVNEGGLLRINTESNQTFSNLALTLQGGTISGIQNSNFDFYNGSSSLTTLASSAESTVTMNARLRQANTTFTVNNGGAAVDLRWSGALNETGGANNFIKAGEGRMDLTGNATYSGSTTINGGHMLFSGEFRNTSSINVNNGSTLELGRTNMFTGGHGSEVASSRVITVNGSTLLMNSSMDSRIGNITLNNGSTWTSDRGLGNYDVLLGNVSSPSSIAATVSVTGAGASTMNGSGGIHLQGVQNFAISNVTGDDNVDLAVNMRLDNYGSAGGADGGINKTGAGLMLLNNINNSFAGNLTVAEGAIRTGTSQADGATGYLGAVNNSRTITVNSGAILDLRANNVFGGGGKIAANLPSIAINGGTLTATRFNIVGNITLNGGTLTQNSTDSGDYQGYQFLGAVTVDGISPSTISAGNLGTANHLLGDGTTTFSVGNVTNSSATDLTISAPLTNGSGDYIGVGALEKTGVGTLELTATSTYTGATTISAGTLLVTGALANTVVTVKADATIGGVGSLGGTLAFETGSTLLIADLNDALAVTGTIAFAAGWGIANLSGVDWDQLDLNTPYTLLSTAQTFDASQIANFGAANMIAVGSGDRSAYFQNGSLALVIVPEPSSALLGCLGALALLRRRRH